MFKPSLSLLTARSFLVSCMISVLGIVANAQPLTGVWHGKIKKNGGVGGGEQVELKMVRDGDSLFGAAYSYRDPSRFERIPIKGHVDPWTGTVSFWEESADGELHRGQLVFETDFNCPGEGVLLLDGTGGPRSDPEKKDVTAHFQKVNDPIFKDEWDLAINDPMYRENSGERPGEIYRRLYTPGAPVKQAPPMVKTAAPPVVVKAAAPSKPLVPPSPQEMLDSRSRRLVAEIPVTGDSIELAFYDNAEIDGDSIALFMNGKLMYAHVLLKASAFIVKVPMADLQESNELVMVAENQGSIPPNTSLMVTYVDGKRYEAILESTEGSSAMIRFYKPSGAGPVKPRR